MTPEHLTNEELANWMVPFTSIDDGKTVYAEKVVAEAARRLRTSIPKPVVEVVWSKTNMGVMHLVMVSDKQVYFHSDEAFANDFAKTIRKALGMEGGGDDKENVS